MGYHGLHSITCDDLGGNLRSNLVFDSAHIMLFVDYIKFRWIILEASGARSEAIA